MLEIDKKNMPDLLEIVDTMADRCVLVVGDIMLDRFVYGTVARISPEAPVPVLKVGRENAMLGGAGNVIANLCGLGIAPLLVGLIANDSAGLEVRSLLSDANIPRDGLVIAEARPTTVKTRFLASHQQLLRTDNEDTSPVESGLEDNILERAQAAMDRAKVMILSDYGKGVLSGRVTKELIAAARARGLTILVDPKGSDYGRYRGADIVTPNRKELSEAANGAKTDSDAEVTAAAQSIIAGAGIGNVIATRSQDGMSIIPKDGRVVHLRTEALEVFDVSGAGDTVIATIAAALAAGASLEAAAAIANCAGGIVVAKVGTASIRHGELVDALVHRDISLRESASDSTGGRAGIVDRTREALVVRREEGVEQVARWKARGLKVGFTNGCFDIVHPGHVAYLNRARDRCDRLVLGLNCDDSVRRLKGPTRPVNDEQARALVMAALGSVDLVVLFGYDKAEQDMAGVLIAALKPDIYFKGADYTEDRVPEAQIVRAYGGEFALVPLMEGHSTTATIGRMQKG